MEKKNHSELLSQYANNISDKEKNALLATNKAQFPQATTPQTGVEEDKRMTDLPCAIKPNYKGLIPNNKDIVYGPASFSKSKIQELATNPQPSVDIAKVVEVVRRHISNFIMFQRTDIDVMLSSISKELEALPVSNPQHNERNKIWDECRVEMIGRIKTLFIDNPTNIGSSYNEALQHTIEQISWEPLDLPVSSWDGIHPDILAERLRQINIEGYSTEHDDFHHNYELADAGYCYLHADNFRDCVPHDWPWANKYWKPSPGNPNRELIKAGALYLAEIQRLQRIVKGISDKLPPPPTHTQTIKLRRK